MNLLTTATRIWLTRTLKPFIFTNEFDAHLPYAHTSALGLYVHIPFCRSLCSFCPYCKVQYHPDLCDRYMDALIQEIHQVGDQLSTKKTVTSCYFGGGSPALAIDRLPEIIAALRKHFTITDGIGVELHPQDVTVETLSRLKAAGVTKICIGIQSFQSQFLKLLGRGALNTEDIFQAIRAVPFETVSMDFIFALPGQTLESLQADLDLAFSSGANHVAIYPFIDFSFTQAGVAKMSQAEKRTLLDGITRYCQSKGYARDSIWTFSKEPGASYSSMTRDNFLGFGCSATTLLEEQFKINTFSVKDYIRRIQARTLPTALTLRFTGRQRKVYYLFWTAYGTRVDRRDFERFFGVSLESQYGFEVWLAQRLGYVTHRDGVYHMTLKGAFFYHVYESYYTLAYIDKMWNVMREQAFPERITL